jgi:hypothetical protein
MTEKLLSDRLTMMIHTCNKFSDLWDAHINLLNKNWANRSIDTFLVTDEATDRTFFDVSVISAGQGAELSERTRVALDFIRTEYILITLDDYFPIYPVYSDKIVALLNIMEKENLDYIRLFSDPNSYKKLPDYRNLYKIDLEQNYDVNLYQGIWRKSFLEKTIRQPLNAWQYEVSLTKIARDYGARCILSKGDEFRILDVVRKGKLLHKANWYLKRHRLYDGPREVISYREEFKILLFAAGKKILPKSIAKWVKKILIKHGHNFYSDSV